MYIDEAYRRFKQGTSSLEPTPRESTLAILKSIELIRPEWQVVEPVHKHIDRDGNWVKTSKPILQLVIHNKPYNFDRRSPEDNEAIHFLNAQGFRWTFYGARSFYIHVT